METGAFRVEDIGVSSRRTRFAHAASFTPATSNAAAPIAGAKNRNLLTVTYQELTILSNNRNDKTYLCHEKC